MFCARRTAVLRIELLCRRTVAGIIYHQSDSERWFQLRAVVVVDSTRRTVQTIWPELSRKSAWILACITSAHIPAELPDIDDRCLNFLNFFQTFLSLSSSRTPRFQYVLICSPPSISIFGVWFFSAHQNHSLLLDANTANRFCLKGSIRCMKRFCSLVLLRHTGSVRFVAILQPNLLGWPLSAHMRNSCEQPIEPTHYRP